MHSVIEQRQANQLSDQYRELFHSKFGRAPSLAHLEHAMFKAIVKRVGYDDASDAMGHYFEMRDEYFIQRYYDVETFGKNLNKIIGSMGLNFKKETAQHNLKLWPRDEALAWEHAHATIHRIGRDKFMPGLTKRFKDQYPQNPPTNKKPIEPTPRKIDRAPCHDTTSNPGSVKSILDSLATNATDSE